MKCTAESLKETLLSMIQEMGEHPEKYANGIAQIETHFKEKLSATPGMVNENPKECI